MCHFFIYGNFLNTINISIIMSRNRWVFYEKGHKFSVPIYSINKIKKISLRRLFESRY